MSSILDLSDIIDQSQLAPETDPFPNVHRSEFETPRMGHFWAAWRTYSEHVKIAATVGPFTAWPEPSGVFLSGVLPPTGTSSTSQSISQGQGFDMSLPDGTTHDMSPPLDANEDATSDQAETHFTSINGIADTTNTVASPGGAGTQLVSSAVASGLHTVEQMTTNNKHVNCIPSAFVEGNTDPQNVIDQEPVLADSADGHVLAESGLGSSSGSQSIQSCSSAQVRDQVIQTTESQVLATGPSAGKIVRRSNRNRERTEATSSMTPIHSDHPLKRARIGNTPTNKSKTAAVVVSKPKPIAMADGRFACPHCPAQQFE
ncbi:predicted protein, partial [Postia placenta Mad-698-R]